MGQAHSSVPAGPHLQHGQLSAAAAAGAGGGGAGPYAPQYHVKASTSGSVLTPAYQKRHRSVTGSDTHGRLWSRVTKGTVGQKCLMQCNCWQVCTCRGRLVGVATSSHGTLLPLYWGGGGKYV